MTVLYTPQDGSTQTLLTEFQREFNQNPCGGGDAGKIDWEHPVYSEDNDCSHPLPVEFSWKSDREDYCFSISESPDLTAAVVRRGQGHVLQLENLRANTRYFWRVNDSEIFSFDTEDAQPRWLHCEGPSNIRDLGNWKTRDGHRIRQGVLYRGGEMDSHAAKGADGIRVLREEVGIRTDLDLRREMLGRCTESPLGEDVRYLQAPIDGYQELIDHPEECKRVFDILVDARNYPIYFHCVGGADRTGSIAFLLEAFLGVEEQDLMLDYELTTISRWGQRCRNNGSFQAFLTALSAYGGEGDGYQEQAERFLLACGLSETDLARLRRNLLV